MTVNESVGLFKVTQSGPQACFQDLGRRQAMHQGVTESGGMDIHAMCWANRLLERDAANPVIEIAMGGFALCFLADTQIAITGADLGATLNGVNLKPWQSISVRASDILAFAYPKNGLRAYLAINAEIDVASEYSSIAGVAREKIGSSMLTKDTQVNATNIIRTESNHAVPARYIPDYSQALVLNLIVGYQYHRFPSESVQTFLDTEYEIRDISNRMAYCLSGTAVEHPIKNLASEGLAYGAVQIPPDGQPIILLNDRQTMGGYPKLGCITRLSGAALAQRFTPSKVCFRLMDIDAAREEYRDFLAFFMRE